MEENPRSQPPRAEACSGTHTLHISTKTVHSRWNAHFLFMRTEKGQSTGCGFRTKPGLIQSIVVLEGNRAAPPGYTCHRTQRAVVNACSSPQPFQGGAVITTCSLHTCGPGWKKCAPGHSKGQAEPASRLERVHGRAEDRL